MSTPTVAVRARDPLVGRSLDAGSVVALPWVGSYVLAARADRPSAVASLLALAPGSASPQLLVGQSAQARQFAGDWSDEVQRLVDRCWPGPLALVVVPSSGDAPMAVSMPPTRPLRRLCRAGGPWVMAVLPMTSAGEVVASQLEVACVVDGGPCAGPGPTVVDGTVVPPMVVEEGVLPAAFIEAALLMRPRRRWFSSLPGAG